MSNAFAKRVWAEFQKLQGLSLTSSSPVKFIIDSSPYDDEDSASSNSNTFIGRILPKSPPFDQTALKVQIELPLGYPAHPPTVRILTLIYHPNVFEDGGISPRILRGNDGWKPSCYLDEVIKELVNIIDHPNTDAPVNNDVAKEYLENRTEYDRKALLKVQENPVPRQ